MRQPIGGGPWTGFLLSSLFLCALSSGAATAATARPETKLAPAVASRVSELMSSGLYSEPISVIVQTWGFPGRTELSIVEEAGGQAGTPFTSIQAFPATVPARELSKLALNPRIKRISSDWQVTPHLDPSALAAGTSHALAPAGSFTGRGVAVALLDSGVTPATESGGGKRLAGEVDIVEPDEQSRDPFGHGTHLAGIITGSGAASDAPESAPRLRGVAPGARIVSVKVLDHAGRGYASSVIAGTDWVIKNHEAQGIRVMVVPLGHPIDESYEDDPLCQAMEAAWKAGIAVVVSAGNNGGQGYATITSPGNDPLVITVGAAEDWNTPETSDDLVASFSSRGPTSIDGVIKPDIIAPGTGILSLRSPGSYLESILPERDAEDETGSGLLSLSGTSMAASIVAGASALLIQQDPDARPDDVKARLMIGAAKMQDSIIARGAGLLDIRASLQLGDMGVASASSRSPSSWWSTTTRTERRSTCRTSAPLGEIPSRGTRPRSGATAVPGG